MSVPLEPQSPFEEKSCLTGSNKKSEEGLDLSSQACHLSYSLLSTPIVVCICLCFSSVTNLALVNLGWLIDRSIG